MDSTKENMMMILPENMAELCKEPCWQNVPIVVTTTNVHPFSLRFLKTFSTLKAILNSTTKNTSKQTVLIHTAESRGLKKVFTEVFLAMSRKRNADLKLEAETLAFPFELLTLASKSICHNV